MQYLEACANWVICSAYVFLGGMGVWEALRLVHEQHAAPSQEHHDGREGRGGGSVQSGSKRRSSGDGAAGGGDAAGGQGGLVH